MKSAISSVALLLVGLFLGCLLNSGALERRATAQAPVPVGNAPRYQISAWGMGAGTGISQRMERGCYIVDTMTGELWHVAADGAAKKLANNMK